MQGHADDEIWEIVGAGKGCKLCAYWVAKVNPYATETETGHCVCMPPRAAGNGMATWPITWGYQWCAKFKKGRGVCDTE